ncbi:alanine--tRNA ligase-related protein [Pendulispora rubella]|uniref:Alanine--tRNA ligase n=1 Tax=Pendulispora rubella TaxID=2741070 RepID=A0ABZ2KTQ2_9BACT
MGDVATKKLYWDDPFATSFEAEASLGQWQGRPSIVLDRTLFYPEGGGQNPDAGKLVLEGNDAELPIVDVQVDDAGTIHHLTEPAHETALTAMAVQRARGEIDADRRRDHMAQHSAQHMLSRALLDVAKAATVSARLGATSCTIDVDVAGVKDADLHRVEDLVNAAIRADVVVRQLFPTEAELATLPLRRAPKVASGIRLIEVDGFDLTPCGGTHVTRTGQIGAARIVGTERYKGKIRLAFHAAQRALTDVRAKEVALSALARELTCGPTDVGVAVAKLRAELKAKNETLTATRSELVTFLAEKALAAHPATPGAPALIVLVRERDDVNMLRTLSGKLTARADVVAFCTAIDRDSGDHLAILQRGQEPGFDCGAWFKEATKVHGGRGGGNKERAEGRFPGATDFAALEKSLRAALR